MFEGLRHAFRLAHIARTLARHDALFPLDLVDHMPLAFRFAQAAAGWRPPGKKKPEGRPGQRLARALQSLGPAFIKLGQGLATRADLVGEEVADDLSELQDRLAPFDSTTARAIITRELGAPVETLFDSFEDTPVAAASMAQVHYAITSDGRAVAVKVLRPGLEEAFQRDLATFEWAARLAERALAESRRLRLVEVVRTLASSVAIEMDLRLEAAAAAQLRENTACDPGYRVPEVDWRRTGRRVLTTERITGLPVQNVAALRAAGHDLAALATTVVQSFLRQALRDGFFHADLHQGNLFVDDDGVLVAIDFGIMGQLDARSRRFLAEILHGFLHADYRRVAEVHIEAGYVPADKSVEAFSLACRSIGEPLAGQSASEISIGRFLAQLFQITRTFDMHTQPQLLLLQKTMVMAEGMALHLNPEANLWEIAEPVVEQWMIDNLGPEARLEQALTTALRSIRRIPALFEQAEQAAHILTGEGLKLHPDTLRHLAREQARARRPYYLALGALGALAGALWLVF